jgi:hypothetical protein
MFAWKSDDRRPEDVLRDLLGHQFPNPITNPDKVWTLNMILGLFLDTTASSGSLPKHAHLTMSGNLTNPGSSRRVWPPPTSLTKSGKFTA